MSQPMTRRMPDALPSVDTPDGGALLRHAWRETRQVLDEHGVHLALYESVRIFAGIVPFLATLVAMRMAAARGNDAQGVAPGPLGAFDRNHEVLSATLRTGMAFGVFNEFCDVLARTDKALLTDAPAGEKLAFVGRGLAREMAVEFPATMLGATMLVGGQYFQKFLKDTFHLDDLAADALANGIAFDAYLRVRGGAKQGLNAVIDWVADHWPWREDRPDEPAPRDAEPAEKIAFGEKLAKFAIDELVAVAAFALYKLGQRRAFGINRAEGNDWAVATPALGQPGQEKTFGRLMDTGIEGYVPFIAVAQMLRFKEELWNRVIPKVFHGHRQTEQTAITRDFG